ncbi:Transmembrane protein 62 [Smittium culicis]|uniref:Transmembrane protein 62 n=1 Tax=Smittium culicis TaxID=133412 RepID=A0A1R1YFA6_9FUNG|nr:Transmembrane protein 62 [Smittium culicis]
MHLLLFLRQALPMIAPRHLFITGDLTDGKDNFGLSSSQQIEEWEAYNSVLEQFKLNERNNSTFAFDQRGNHDCFNVGGWGSNENYYSKYSISKTPGYLLNSEFNGKNYCFISTDGCPKRGFGRPMNFFGFLNSKDVENVVNAINDNCISSEHVFMLNHYPTAVMRYGKLNQKNNRKFMPNGFRLVLEKVSAFLCGHLHKLAGGIGEDLKANNKNPNYLELELADLKLNAIYRIFAVDNGLISFTDVTLPIKKIPLLNPTPNNPLSVVNNLSFSNIDMIPQAPIILITNPKESKYFIIGRENLDITEQSKSIRILIYSPRAIEEVKVFIDSVFVGFAEPKFNHIEVSKRMEKFENSNYEPLFTLEWDPSLYRDSKNHNLTVLVKSSSKLNNIPLSSKSIFFNMDIKKIPTPLNNEKSGGLIMKSDFYRIFRDLVFFFYLFGFFILILIPKLISEQINYNFLQMECSLNENRNVSTDRSISHLFDEILRASSCFITE